MFRRLFRENIEIYCTNHVATSIAYLLLCVCNVVRPLCYGPFYVLGPYAALTVFAIASHSLGRIAVSVPSPLTVSHT